MNTKNDVEVIINGRTYIISGYESSEYMQKIATHINSKYDEFKKSDSFPKLDQEMKNILLAINLSDDYYKAQDVVVNLQKDNEDLEKEIFHMKHDMIDLKSRLEKQEKKNKSLKTTKKDNIRHGHGVQSVRKVVEKYNGTVSFTDKGDIFEVSAMLYGIEVKE